MLANIHKNRTFLFFSTVDSLSKNNNPIFALMIGRSIVSPIDMVQINTKGKSTLLAGKSVFVCMLNKINGNGPSINVAKEIMIALFNIFHKKETDYKTSLTFN